MEILHAKLKFGKAFSDYNFVRFGNGLVTFRETWPGDGKGHERNR
jgi:hypothetical protein